MKRPTSLLLAALISLASAAYATDATPAKPSANAAQAVKLSVSRSATQAEDKSYTGAEGKTLQRARAKPSKLTTGGEDLGDLEVQRLKKEVAMTMTRADDGGAWGTHGRCAQAYPAEAQSDAVDLDAASGAALPARPTPLSRAHTGDCHLNV